MDFDDIADLWQQEPSADESRAFEQLARQASRKARLMQYAEIGLGAVLIACVLIALSLDAAPATVAIGALIVLAVSWSAWSRNFAAEVRRIVDASDRERLLETAVESAAKRLRHSTLGIALLPPGFLLGVLLKYSASTQGNLHGFGSNFLSSLSSGWGLISLLLVLLALAWFLRGNLRLRRDLARLRELQQGYREEARLDRES